MRMREGKLQIEHIIRVCAPLLYVKETKECNFDWEILNFRITHKSFFNSLPSLKMKEKCI